MTLDEFIYKEQYVDKHGGVLIVPEANISLHVPPGAVRNGVILSITVLRDSNSFLSGTGVQSKVTPQVICEPDGITFLTPVELILPHCAVVDKPEVQKVTVYFGNKKKHFDKGKHTMLYTDSGLVYHMFRYCVSYNDIKKIEVKFPCKFSTLPEN